MLLLGGARKVAVPMYSLDCIPKPLVDLRHTVPRRATSRVSEMGKTSSALGMAAILRVGRMWYLGEEWVWV